jgi:hypothetical protein
MQRLINDNPAAVRVIAPAILGVILLLAWQAICQLLKVPTYLVPMPTDIAETLVQDWSLLTSALLVTLKVTFLAFALSVVLGVLAAFLFVQSRVMEVSLFPYAIILQVTPIVAIAPLIIIWVKDTHVALVLTVAITTVCWVVTAFVTPPTDRDVLIAFYRKVRPVGPGWKPIRDIVGVDLEAHAARDSIPLGLLGWSAGSMMIWSALFAVGNVLYGRRLMAGVLTVTCLACTAVVLWVMRLQWPDNA